MATTNILGRTGSLLGSMAPGSSVFSCSFNASLWSGLDQTTPIDKYGTSSGNSTTAVSPTLTTTQTGDLLLSCFGFYPPSITVISSYPGWTELAYINGTPTGSPPNIPYAKGQGSALAVGSYYDFVGPLTSVQWTCVYVAFKI